MKTRVQVCPGSQHNQQRKIYNTNSTRTLLRLLSGFLVLAQVHSTIGTTAQPAQARKRGTNPPALQSFGYHNMHSQVSTASTLVGNWVLNHPQQHKQITQVLQSRVVYECLAPWGKRSQKRRAPWERTNQLRGMNVEGQNNCQNRTRIGTHHHPWMNERTRAKKLTQLFIQLENMLDRNHTGSQAIQWKWYKKNGTQAATGMNQSHPEKSTSRKHVHLSQNKRSGESAVCNRTITV